MGGIDETKDMNPNYDARRNPRRGVKVPPLPRHVHSEFRRFCDGLRTHAQSHLSTWTLAKSYGDDVMTRGQTAYWRAVLKYINYIEYLGTTNARHR
jgi:hypothetical protein